MHAIIVTGGKQYKVSEGDTLFIEKLPAEAGDQVVFDQVLAVLGEGSATIGTPTVAGATVEASVVKNGKGKKIRIFKYNPKKPPGTAATRMQARISSALPLPARSGSWNAC